MGFDDCYLLGKLVKTHGLKGEIVAHLDVDFPEDYQNLESVFVDQDGQLVPFFISAISIRDNKAYLLFDDYGSLDLAKELIGFDLYLPLDQLPDLPDGGYYFHQLVGMTVYDSGDELGEVKDVFELPHTNLLSVDHGGTEVLIPIEDDIITSVDLTSQKIETKLPDGLLSIYLEEAKSKKNQ